MVDMWKGDKLLNFEPRLNVSYKNSAKFELHVQRGPWGKNVEKELLYTKNVVFFYWTAVWFILNDSFTNFATQWTGRGYQIYDLRLAYFCHHHILYEETEIYD